MNGHARIVVAALTSAICLIAQAAEPAALEQKPYRIVNGKTSYRIVLDSEAARSDDPTAVRDGFVAEVLRRERGDVVMPAWEGDSKVHPHLLDLYAYLKARADGALGPGKPQRLGK